MIIRCTLPKMKNRDLPTCLQGNYRDSLGEFSNTSLRGVLGLRGLNQSYTGVGTKCPR